ncbi:hypothetical protein OAC78_04925 [Litorivicinus sp.]|nr:hypothetical protein [Litorivicinus sp.]
MKVIVFMTIPHTGFDFLIFKLAKILNIETISFYRLPTVGHFCSLYLLRDLDDPLPALKNVSKEVIDGNGNEYLSDRISCFLKVNATPEYATFTGAESSTNLVECRNFSNLEFALKKIKKRLEAISRLWSYLRLLDFIPRLLIKFDDIRAKQRVNVIDPGTLNRFVLVPLHFQPEASTSPLGGHYVLQFLFINQIADLLPDDVQIAIKFNPRNGDLSRFLRGLMPLSDKIVFIDKSFDSSLLIEKSICVATVTGTVGWEAVAKGKPVLLFGDCFYKYAPGVFRIRSFASLVEALEIILAGEGGASESEFTKFLWMLQKNTFEGWVDHRYQAISRLDANENNIILKNKIFEAIDQSR